MTLPIACELRSEERRMREAEIRRGLTSGAREIEILPDGLALHFEGADEWIDRIAEVLKAERGCCRFLRFRLDAAPGNGRISLTITGPDGTAEFLRGWVVE